MSLNLDLTRIEDREDLLDELEKVFERDSAVQQQIEELSDAVEYTSVLNAVQGDLQAISYNTKGLPTSANFKADGKQGKITWTYTDYRVTDIEITYPSGEPFFRIIINWKSNNWQIDSVELEKFQPETSEDLTTP